MKIIQMWIILCRLYSLNLFLPAITKATRFSPCENENILPTSLDNIWINTLNAFTSGILDYDFSDHCPTCINFLLPNPLVIKPKYNFTFRPYSEENQDKFIDKLVQTDWNVLYQIDNTGEMLSVFCEKINSYYSQCFPLKTKQISYSRINKPWLASELIQSYQIKV